MKKVITLASIIFSLLAFTPAMATSILPITLEQLSTRATLIFYGEAIDNQVRVDEQSGQIATYTTFNIIDLVKGDAGSTHTIKQIGGQLKNSNVALRIHGVPSFQPGSNYVVFLPNKSKLGFSSPLGLHQGSFTVSTVNDEKIVSNGRQLAPSAQARNNHNIQVPLAVKASNPSQSRLNDFMNAVRAFNAK